MCDFILYGFETCIGWETLALTWAPWLITVVMALVAAWKITIGLVKGLLILVQAGLGI